MSQVTDDCDRECQEGERPGSTGSQQAYTRVNIICVDSGRCRALYVSAVVNQKSDGDRHFPFPSGSFRAMLT